MAKTIFTEGVPGGDPATVVTADWLNAMNNPNFDGLDEDASFTLPTATVDKIGAVHIAESFDDARDDAVPTAAMVRANEATTTTLGAVYLASGAGDQRPNAVPNVGMAAGLGMPSELWLDISVPNDGDFYLAPANGFIQVNAIVNSGIFELNIDSTLNAEARLFSGMPIAGTTSAGRNGYIHAPAGTKIYFQYDPDNVTFSVCRFVYAQGAY